MYAAKLVVSKVLLTLRWLARELKKCDQFFDHLPVAREISVPF